MTDSFCCLPNDSQRTLDAAWPQPTTDHIDFRFENDFAPSVERRDFQPLPDKEEYLQLLERKLNKLKNGLQSDSGKRRQIIDQLCEARKECLERLVDSDGVVFENEQPTVRSSGLTAWINPEQPLSSTETQRLIEQDARDE